MAKTRMPGKFTFESFFRIFADAILVNLALLIALSARLLFIVAYGNLDTNVNYRSILWEYMRSYGNSAWLLTILCLVIFSASGFYTYGRAYRSRYKYAIIIQAVGLAYLILGLVTYLAQGFLLDFLSPLFNIPRGVLIVAWALTTLFLALARAWATIWRKIIHNEDQELTGLDDWKIKKILVIGGAGYIGSALLPRLLKKDYEVRLLDLLLYGLEPIEKFMDHPNLELIQEDFRSIDKVVEAMRDVDAVIHLGGIVGDPACALDEELTIDINIMATRMIAEVAKGSGVRTFIFASTCSVYGANDQMLDEKSQLNPVSLYARSKIASEKVLLKMADNTFSPVILRLSTIYGLSGRTRFDLVVNLLTAKAFVENEITIFGGDQWRPFLHVEDAAEAIAAVIDSPIEFTRSQIFNVGSNDQNFTINQIGEFIQEMVPTAKIIKLGDDTDKRNYWVNFNKISKTLDFQPAWTISKGITQVLDALQSERVDDYRSAKYSNVKFLTEEGIYRLARTENGWVYQLLNENLTDTSVILNP